MESITLGIFFFFTALLCFYFLLSKTCHSSGGEFRGAPLPLNLAHPFAPLSSWREVEEDDQSRGERKRKIKSRETLRNGGRSGKARESEEEKEEKE